MHGELLVPPMAEQDPKAIEVVRVWVAKGGQHVSINPLVWKDPEAWGIVLADLAGHLANAYMQEAGLDRKETLRKITDLLIAELKNPTDQARGQVHNTRRRIASSGQKQKESYASSRNHGKRRRREKNFRRGETPAAFSALHNRMNGEAPGPAVTPRGQHRRLGPFLQDSVCLFRKERGGAWPRSSFHFFPEKYSSLGPLCL